ncbi:outer spore coat protein CotE [Hydrogenibacillus schlegelii]|nr:outer spore coat protein CotE [Hydrogenibacillus schlegelii]
MYRPLRRGEAKTMATNETEMASREIITKAVVARGSRLSQTTHQIATPHAPSSILGCWVINHTFVSHKAGDEVEVKGAYDIDVWYSYDDNTKTEVAKETVQYVERIPLSFLDSEIIGDAFEVRTRVTEAPNAVEAKVHGAGAQVVVEKAFSTEVIGETKLCVYVAPSCGEVDDEEEKDDGFDDGEIIIEDLR